MINTVPEESSNFPLDMPPEPIKGNTRVDWASSWVLFLLVFFVSRTLLKKNMEGRPRMSGGAAGVENSRSL